MTGDSVTFCMLLETRCQQQLKKIHSRDEDLNQMEKALDSDQNVYMTLNAANLFTQELHRADKNQQLSSVCQLFQFEL